MRTARVVAAGLCALLALALPTGAATADEWATGHFTGDYESLEQVRIDNALHNLFLHTGWTHGFPEGDVYYWLDTRRRSPGPEFRVRVYLDEFNSNGSPIPGITIHRVEGSWGTVTGRKVRCPVRGWLSEAGDVDVTVPRACLRIRGHLPGSVRMSVGIFFAYGGPDFNGSWAWSPARHRFGPWVAHT
jgi:hypothetical protein